MANILELKGARTPRPTRYAPLWNCRYATGIWTQRNPLRDAASTRLEETWYGNRGDSIIDGLNTEVSAGLTMIRRPGLSVYNSQTFPPITRFYENRTSVFNGTQTQLTEAIQVVCDTSSLVYDCTGPSTKNVIWTKSSGAGSTYFQGVGNSLYFTNGVDRKKLITPNKIWAANQNFNSGDMILDSNGNVQVVEGTASASISSITVVSTRLGLPTGPLHYFLAIAFTSDVFWPAGTNVSFSGVTNYIQLNGRTLSVFVNDTYLPPSSTVAYFPALSNTVYGPAADTGTATSTTGSNTSSTGASEPVWNASLGGTTTDNTITWQNFGKPIYDWATAAPTQAPTLFPVSGNRQWQPNATLNLWYSVLDNNNNIQVAIDAISSSYITGTKAPVWSSSVPSATTTSGATTDGNIVWQNCGPMGQWVASTAYLTFQCILDSNLNLQIATSGAGSGSHTGATAPTWATGIGSTTVDGSITWTCVGPGSVIATGSYQYAYSWHSIDGSVTTAAPIAYLNEVTAVLGPANNPIATLGGSFPTDSQIDAVWIWRTTSDGGTLFYDQYIANTTPGSSNGWSLSDYLPDTSLDILIQAPIADANDPPPTGLGPLAYHLGRVWGAVGNTVQYSQGPDAVSGNGNTAWSPSNAFVYPSTVYRFLPTSSGLIVFTSSGLYIIQGLGTSSSSFYSAPYLENIGLLSYDAFSVNGSIVFLYSSDNQVLALDPNGGVSEVGFPIGDQFGPSYGSGTFTPSSTRVTWHVAGSPDKGLYVSDFSGTYWRLCPTPAPETGMTWSPKGQPLGGFSAVQSVETVPGTHELLFGPKTSGPILQRDATVYTDNGSAYDAYFILGSIVLAQPGQWAVIESLTTDATHIGSALTLAVQLDEIASLSSGYFENLTSLDTNGNNIPDPTTLESPKSLYAQRFYLSQTQQPAICRHLQVQVKFGTDSVKNEMLSLSIWGGYEQEK